MSVTTSCICHAWERPAGDHARSCPMAPPRVGRGAEPTGDLREQIAEVAHESIGCDDESWGNLTPPCWRVTTAVLALPAVRDALAAQETLRQIRVMRVKVQRALDDGVPILQAQQVADHLDRALAGDSS